MGKATCFYSDSSSTELSSEEEDDAVTPSLVQVLDGKVSLVTQSKPRSSRVKSLVRASKADFVVDIAEHLGSATVGSCVCPFLDCDCYHSPNVGRMPHDQALGALQLAFRALKRKPLLENRLVIIDNSWTAKYGYALMFACYYHVGAIDKQGLRRCITAYTHHKAPRGFIYHTALSILGIDSFVPSVGSRPSTADSGPKMVSLGKLVIPKGPLCQTPT